ncbi:MAG TPA: hypothetical protein VNO70_01325 [Blastocatellia bacterium]|nr:hypothetical protein [Blastocatellia bacterium]
MVPQISHIYILSAEAGLLSRVADVRRRQKWIQPSESVFTLSAGSGFVKQGGPQADKIGCSQVMFSRESGSYSMKGYAGLI